jgi:hypothetical protein
MDWITYGVASYAIAPACTWVGATVGVAVGKKIATKVWKAGKDKLNHVVNYTLSITRIYIVNKGVLIEIDPRKKYMISNGEVRVINDAESDWTLI